MGKIGVLMAVDYNTNMLEKLNVDVCMECGCCSYVCPAKRNIVQRNKMAKTMLRSYQIEKKKREEAQKNG